MKKEITVYSIDGTHQQLKEYEPKLKRQLRYFFKPAASLIVCEHVGFTSVRIDELMLKDIFEMNKPKLPCPLCTRKYYTKQQVIACMEADQKEEKVKNRKLKLIKK
jgi:hypothetical protein